MSDRITPHNTKKIHKFPARYYEEPVSALPAPVQTELFGTPPEKCAALPFRDETIARPLTFQISPDLHTALRIAARAERKTPSQVVSEILTTALSSREPESC